MKHSLPEVVCPVNFLLHRRLVVKAHPLILVISSLDIVIDVVRSFSFGICVDVGEVIDSCLFIMDNIWPLILYDVLNFWQPDCISARNLAKGLVGLPKYPNVPAPFVQGPGEAAPLNLQPTFEQPTSSSWNARP